MFDDGIVAWRTRLDDLSRDEIGIYDGEGVGRLGDDGRHGRLARRDGACETEEQHRGLVFYWRNAVDICDCKPSCRALAVDVAFTWRVHERWDDDCGERIVTSEVSMGLTINPRLALSTAYSRAPRSETVVCYNGRILIHVSTEL